MALESNLFSYSLPAANTPPLQFTACVVNTSGQAAIPGSAGVQVLGIVGNAPGTQTPGSGVAQQSCQIQFYGVAKVKVGSGAGVTAGDSLRTDTAGCAVTNTGSSGYATFGIALDTAAASALCTCALIPSGKD